MKERSLQLNASPKHEEPKSYRETLDFETDYRKFDPKTILILLIKGRKDTEVEAIVGLTIKFLTLLGLQTTPEGISNGKLEHFIELSLRYLRPSNYLGFEGMFIFLIASILLMAATIIFLLAPFTFSGSLSKIG